MSVVVDLLVAIREQRVISFGVWVPRLLPLLLFLSLS